MLRAYFWLAGFLATAASAYLLGCAGAPPPNEIARCATGPPERIPESILSSGSGNPARGTEVFAEYCAKCHAPLVSERSSRLFRDHPRLDCDEYLDRVSASYLTTVIRSGGPSVGLGKSMKPFASELTAEQIADVVAYILSRQDVNRFDGARIRTTKTSTRTVSTTHSPPIGDPNRHE